MRVFLGASVVTIVVAAILSFLDLETGYLTNFGVSIPKEKQVIVGTWVHENSVISIKEDGKFYSKTKEGTSETTLNVSVQEIGEQYLRVGFSVLGTKFKFKELPKIDSNGKKIWVVDGRKYQWSAKRVPANHQ